VHQSFVLSLKPGAIGDYIRHHEAIRSSHPDLAHALVESGVNALRIYLDGERLVLCVDAKDDQSMQRLWATEAHKRWSTLMDPLIEVGADGVPVARFLTKVYEFSADDAP
jgi:L-rhamnose mutarotase